MRNRTANMTVNVGLSADLPVTGDSNYGGQNGPGVYRNVTPLFSPGCNGTGAWNGAVTATSYHFGLTGDSSVTGAR
jgi:hypothetical protein